MPDHVAAVIGAGRIGVLLEDDPRRVQPATHAGMWAACPRVRLAAICDPDEEKLAVAKARFPMVETFTDAEEMLRAVRPDSVSLAMGPARRPDLIALAARRGVRLVVAEKPLALDLASGEAALTAAAAAGATVIVNHARRFDPTLRRLKDELDSGLIGALRQAQATYCYGLFSTGTHLVDLLRMLMAATAGDIVWAAGYPNDASPTAPADDPCCDAVLGFAGGAKAMLQSLDIRDYDNFEVHLFGTAGKVSYRNIGRDLDRYSVVASPGHAGFTELSGDPAERRGGGAPNYFAELARNALGVLDGTSAPLATGADSLAALSVLEAIRASARDGGRRRAVPLPRDARRTALA